MLIPLYKGTDIMPLCVSTAAIKIYYRGKLAPELLYAISTPSITKGQIWDIDSLFPSISLNFFLEIDILLPKEFLGNSPSLSWNFSIRQRPPFSSRKI
jgi:hypothetical protein